MRRRERFQGVAWMAGFAGQEGKPPMAVLSEDTLQPVSGSVDMLLHLGYYLELELVQSSYRLRCLPIPHHFERQHGSVALSYSGVDLRSILASAALEAAMLRNPQHRYHTAGTEVVRWVAC